MDPFRLSRQKALLYLRTASRRKPTYPPSLHDLLQSKSSRPFSTFRPTSRPVSTPKSPFHLLHPHPRGLPITASPSRRLLSSKPPHYNPTPNLTSPTPSLSLSQRLRKLSREYGWSAVGVYLLLSALDFPFCFIAVRWLGTERIGAWEHKVVEWMKRAVPVQIPRQYRFWEREREGQLVGEGEGVDGALGREVNVVDHGVREAEVANAGEKASIWTQLALAYAIHKSFIFIRVPLTAAVTPKVVRVLRGWGWDIGKRKGKSGVAAAGTKVVGKE